jgi:hypothetical protein
VSVLLLAGTEILRLALQDFLQQVIKKVIIGGKEQKETKNSIIYKSIYL